MVLLIREVVHTPIFSFPESQIHIDWSYWFNQCEIKYWPNFNDRLYLFMINGNAVALVYQETLGL